MRKTSNVKLTYFNCPTRTSNCFHNDKSTLSGSTAFLFFSKICSRNFVWYKNSITAWAISTLNPSSFLWQFARIHLAKKKAIEDTKEPSLINHTNLCRTVELKLSNKCCSTIHAITANWKLCYTWQKFDWHFKWQLQRRPAISELTLVMRPVSRYITIRRQSDRTSPWLINCSAQSSTWDSKAPFSFDSLFVTLCHAFIMMTFVSCNHSLSLTEQNNSVLHCITT